MIDCPRCGKPNAKGRAHCEGCGTALPEVSGDVRTEVPDLGLAPREPALTATGLGAFNAFGSGDTMTPLTAATGEGHGEPDEQRTVADPALLAEHLAARNKEIKRLQFDLFRAVERADIAESRAAAAGSGALVRSLKGASVLAAMAAAFAGGLWYGKLDGPAGADSAKAEASWKARFAEQQKKIEELQASLAARKSAPPEGPPAAGGTAMPPAAPPEPPASSAPAPDRGALSPPIEPAPSVPSADRPAHAAAPKTAVAAAFPAGGPREGTITWEGDWRDLIAMAQHRPLTVRIEGNQATTEPETQAATLDGALPGIPVLVEGLEPGISIVEPPAEANGWKRLVFRLTAPPQQDRNSLHVRARLKWSRSDG
jgi:hypothetical protein